MPSWLEFWNRRHRIYVSRRHLEAHYARVAADLLPLLPSGEPDLLDWGCGPALAAPTLAAAGARVSLFDRAPATVATLQDVYRDAPRIRVLDTAAYDVLDAGSFDVMVVNSVVQYLDRPAMAGLLADAYRLVRPGGRLILGDVVPPDARLVQDVRALLGPALRHGYLLAALSSLPATFFSDYRTLRQQIGLASYQPEEVLQLLDKAGFAPHRLPRNIGFHRFRHSFIGERRPSAI